MADLTHGMDLAQVEELGRTFQRLGAVLDDHAAYTQRQVQMSGWVGPDADRFQREWPSIRAYLRSSAEEMRELGHIVERNARDQRWASAPGHGGRPGQSLRDPDQATRVTPCGDVDLTGEPLFPGGYPKADDIEQIGKLGDCWLLASLASAAAMSPDRVARLVTENGDGTYTVHFADGDVTVDGSFDLEGGDPRKGQGALWVSVIEKADAVRRGGHYDDVEGGFSSDAFHSLFGAESHEYAVANMSSHDVMARINEQIAAGRPATASVHGKLGIDGGHAMSITRTFCGPEGDMVVVRNPWGNNGSIASAVKAAGGELGRPDAGYITFSAQEFQQNFSVLTTVEGW